MAIFMDIELVSLDEAAEPGGCVVTFDVIYPGETWCRSVIEVDRLVTTRLGHEERAVVAVARDALLDRLAAELVPVSLHLRLGEQGCSVLARGTPR